MFWRFIDTHSRQYHMNGLEIGIRMEYADGEEGEEATFESRLIIAHTQSQRIRFMFSVLIIF